MKKPRTKEKIGLHPVMLILIFCLITIVLSGILRAFNVQSTFSKVSTTTGDLQVTSEAVRSLFSLSGLKYIFTTTVRSFANFAPLINLIIILIGIGIMVKSEFLKTTTILLTKKMKKTTVTFILILLCILSSLIGDLSYLIFIPLSALIFLYGKRSPMIGIIASYGALTCGSALSLFMTSIDSSVMTMTLNNASILISDYTISSHGYLLVMPILIIILAIILTNITESYIAKKIPKYEFPEEDIEEELVLTKRKMRGLVLSLGAGLIYLIIFIYDIIPGLPLSGTLLDYSQNLYIDKLFSYNSFFSNGFVFIVAVIFVILGLFYGIGAKTIKNNKEFVDGLSHSLNGIGKILVMIFVASAFINIFKQTNIGNVVAGLFTNVITNTSFTGLPLVLLLFLASLVTAIFLPNTLNSWTILSGVVPTLMQAGLTPEFTQLVFRLASSVALGITPLFAYFIVYLAYLENYNQEDKPVTFKDAVRYQLPYTFASLAIFIIFIILWYALGFPLGIGTSVAA